MGTVPCQPPLARTAGGAPVSHAEAVVAISASAPHQAAEQASRRRRGEPQDCGAHGHLAARAPVARRRGAVGACHRPAQAHLHTCVDTRGRSALSTQLVCRQRFRAAPGRRPSRLREQQSPRSLSDGRCPPQTLLTPDLCSNLGGRTRGRSMWGGGGWLWQEHSGGRPARPGR